MEIVYPLDTKFESTLTSSLTTETDNGWFFTQCSCCTVKFIQQKKSSIWALPILSFFFVAGLIFFVAACFKFKDYLILVSFVPIPFICVILILFGMPVPFVLSEDDLLYSMMFESSDDELAKNWGHFMLSCCGTGIFGILAVLYATGVISVSGVVLSVLGHIILMFGGLVFLIRYHYIQDKDDFYEEDEE